MQCLHYLLYRLSYKRSQMYWNGILTGEKIPKCISAYRVHNPVHALLLGENRKYFFKSSEIMEVQGPGISEG